MDSKKKLSVFMPLLILSYAVFLIIASNKVSAGWDCWMNGKEDCDPNNKCSVVRYNSFKNPVYSCKSCKPGFGDCDATGGCKIYFLNDPNNCGGCDIKCKSNQVCYLGECEAAGDSDILICGSNKCNQEDTCSTLEPCKKQINASCNNADEKMECSYQLTIDDSCVNLCASGECRNGECIEPTIEVIKCQEDLIGTDACTTDDCYSGKLTRACKDDGTWGDYYCKSDALNVFQCSSTQKCANGECVKKTECGYGDVDYSSECIAPGCYSGKWKKTCQSDGTWNEGYCTADIPYNYKCSTEQRCVDMECVADDKKQMDKGEIESEYNQIITTLSWIFIIIAVLGGGYGIYYYLLKKYSAKGEQLMPVYAQRRHVLRRPVERTLPRVVVRKKRIEKREKRKKIFEAFNKKDEE